MVPAAKKLLTADDEGGDPPFVFMTAFHVFQRELEKLFPDAQPIALLKKPISIAEQVHP
jgi:hypothetical protein